MWFSHRMETTAPPRRVWEVWTDVEAWPTWDGELREASLGGDDRTAHCAVEVGTRGFLDPRFGPTAEFVVTEVDPGRSYSYTVEMPLGRLHVRRSLHGHDGGTTFTHEVWFEGALRGVYSRTLGRRYRRALPEVMTAVRDRAESPAATGSSTDAA
ncbi:SRPBCC family protein [Halomarina oriensis]|uniref:Polyketide cyclase n=1 Tax=Halomarina oriensis TaxID=671145 RepID=A0A6B0GMB4_9EURY|nr:SRPBCC family protein [Halomarina oriensis]MWG35051.1 polyketide cyclase [Halomarina oriensis]